MPHLVTKDHGRRRFLRRTICRRPVHQARGSHHERNDGIRDRGRLYIGGLLRADDAGAESPGLKRGSSRATDPMAVITITRRATAAASPSGSSATIRPSIARAIRATGTGAIAAAAIDAAGPAKKTRHLDLPQSHFLDSFQAASGSVWNHLKRRFFLLYPGTL